MLLPNDDRTHEVAFALQRSGLYYTMVNTHLAADEAAYIVARLWRPHPHHVGRARSLWRRSSSTARPTSSCGS